MKVGIAMQIYDMQKTNAKCIADFVRTIETMHKETHLSVIPFLTPIFVLCEFSCFQHVAENTDDKYIKESYTIFLKLIDVLNIEVKN